MSMTNLAEKASTASSLHTDRTATLETGDYGGFSGKSSPQEYQAAWLKHAYDGFPRELWDGDRTHKWQTVDRNDYLAILRMQHENFGPAHTSINIGLGPVLGSRYASSWVNKMLLEFDGSGGRPDAAYPEMRRLYSHLKLKYDAEPRVYFSGHRSFHIFVDFAPLTFDNSVEAQRQIAQRIVKELDLKRLDLQIFGERKLSRIPYTMHEATCNYCTPASPFWSLEEIRAESRKPVRYEPVRISFAEQFAAKLREIEGEISSRPKLKWTKGKASTEWIEKLLQRPIPDGGHRVLWHVLAPYLVNVRKLPLDQAEAKLREYFAKCGAIQRLNPSGSSFNRLIRYYLKLAERDGYPPWRLETIEKNDPQLYAIIEEVNRA